MNAVVQLQPNQSLFIVLRKKALMAAVINNISTQKEAILFSNKWNLKFDKNYGTDASLILDELKSWALYPDTAIKYYSGPARYSNSFVVKDKSEIKSVFIELDSIYNIATIKVNGVHCGTLWTPPYRLDISKVIKSGENQIEIEVANTWHNRLIGDSLLPPEKRITWTTAPFRLKEKPLLPAGLIGEIKLLFQ